MGESDERFTEYWDALDPFDQHYPHLWIKVEHLGRYLFAREYLRDRHVSTIVDIGCGTGYGSRELVTIADHVTATDNDEQVLDYARSRYSASRIEFQQRELGVEDGEQPMLDGTFGACVCFEVLEHLVDPLGALKQIQEILEPSGYLILSVPNGTHERVDDVGLLTNKHHRRTFSITSVTELLRSADFGILEVLGQPLAAELNRNETRLLRRKQTDRRVGDNPAVHQEETIRQLSYVAGYPGQRDVEWSYSVTVVARKR